MGTWDSHASGRLGGPAMALNEKTTRHTWFKELFGNRESVFFLLFLADLQKIQISQRRREADQYSDDGDKGTCSVSDILFKHGRFCFAHKSIRFVGITK